MTACCSESPSFWSPPPPLHRASALPCPSVASCCTVCCSYIDVGVKEGARLVCGGKRHGDKGFFIQPTIFADVTDEMTIARHEIFGPVMCVIPYTSLTDVSCAASRSVTRLRDHGR